MLYNGHLMGNVSILLGSTNPAKQDKLHWLLEGLPLDPRLPGDLGLADNTGPEEKGTSHEENARLKAEAWSQDTSLPVISTDGGLIIPVLGHNWDSLLTHRFAGEEADDGERLDQLLQMMRPHKGKEREASWVEALAIAQRGRSLASWLVEGPRGVLLDGLDYRPLIGGFWLFSVWYFPELGKTYNELNEQELQRLSDHWSQLKLLARRFLHNFSPARE